MADDYSRGLYRKYAVTRTDGKDAPGEKHEKCRCTLFWMWITTSTPRRL